MLSLFSNLKTVLGGVVALISSVFGAFFIFSYKKTKNENKNLKKEVDVKNSEIGVQKKVFEDNIKNKDFEIQNIKKDDQIEKESNININKNKGKEYEVKF